jgi:diadenosine tetraphosphate (Ap4A) HIT family hydrolase
MPMDEAKVIATMRSGVAVIGDTQFLPGYSLLLSSVAGADHLTDLPRAQRAQFLVDMSLLGEAVAAACADGLRRVNYSVLGNTVHTLHAHVHPRYDWEPPELLRGPVWMYGLDVLNAPQHAYDEARHGALRAAIQLELEALMAQA